LSAERTTRMGIVVERAYRLSLTRIYKRVRRACVIVRPQSLSLHNDAQWLCPPSISRRGGDDSIDLYRHSPTPPFHPLRVLRPYPFRRLPRQSAPRCRGRLNGRLLRAGFGHFRFTHRLVNVPSSPRSSLFCSVFFLLKVFHNVTLCRI